MKLIDMCADSHGVIAAADSGDMRFISRASAIGLTSGTPLQMVRNDPKMPVLIYVRETLLALSRADAAKIEVNEK